MLDKIRQEAEKMPNPCARLLIRAIITRAAIDSQNPKYKEEVNAFWDTQWAKDLCSVIGGNPQKAKENLAKGISVDIYNVCDE